MDNLAQNGHFWDDLSGVSLSQTHPKKAVNSPLIQDIWTFWHKKGHFGVDVKRSQS